MTRPLHASQFDPQLPTGSPNTTRPGTRSGTVLLPSGHLGPCSPLESSWYSCVHGVRNVILRLVRWSFLFGRLPVLSVCEVRLRRYYAS